MAVKLLVLKSGEDVVADVSEMTLSRDDGSNSVIGYYLKYPCRVRLYGDKTDTERSGSNQSPFKMQLTPWSPLSKDKVIPMVADWVVTITEPIDQLKEMYEKGIERYESRETETDLSDEQLSDSESD